MPTIDFILKDELKKVDIPNTISNLKQMTTFMEQMNNVAIAIQNRLAGCYATATAVFLPEEQAFRFAIGVRQLYGRNISILKEETFLVYTTKYAYNNHLFKTKCLDEYVEAINTLSSYLLHNGYIVENKDSSVTIPLRWIKVFWCKEQQDTSKEIRILLNSYKNDFRLQRFDTCTRNYWKGSLIVKHPKLVLRRPGKLENNFKELLTFLKNESEKGITETNPIPSTSSESDVNKESTNTTAIPQIYTKCAFCSFNTTPASRTVKCINTDKEMSWFNSCSKFEIDKDRYNKSK